MIFTMLIRVNVRGQTRTSLGAHDLRLSFRPSVWQVKLRRFFDIRMVRPSPRNYSNTLIDGAWAEIPQDPDRISRHV